MEKSEKKLMSDDEVFEVFHSLIFTRATHSVARSLLRQRVCLSVCLSHTGILSKRLNLS